MRQVRLQARIGDIVRRGHDVAGGDHAENDGVSCETQIEYCRFVYAAERIGIELIELRRLLRRLGRRRQGGVPQAQHQRAGGNDGVAGYSKTIGEQP